jgi:hypothetical protein
MDLPQECPLCKVSLADRNPAIPAGREKQFSLVLMDAVEFECPVCHHCWPRTDIRGRLKGRPISGRRRRK